MDVSTLIDAIVRQTTVMLAQLATAGGNRAHLAHTANQVFLDLVQALREQGLGSKVIADMFGMALRTYHQRVQRLGESRTERGRTLWEAVYEYLQENGPVSRTELLRRFAHDDEVVVKSLLKDLVDSGLVYRTGRGDHVRYHIATSSEAEVNSPRQTLEDLVCLTAHRLSPATPAEIATTLSLDPDLVRTLVATLLQQGRVRAVGVGASSEPRYTSNGCVIPLGEEQGWEIAIFDHYQAMVTAICTKLRLGRQTAQARDLIGGSTFSYTVWPEHPYYQEATAFLAQFRASSAALREKIARYNQTSDGEGPRLGPGAVKVLLYAGQTLLPIESDMGSQGNAGDEHEDDDETDTFGTNLGAH